MFAFLLWLLVPVAPALADITFCNDGEEEKLIAYIVDLPEYPPVKQWTSVGWTRIAPGECALIVTSYFDRNMMASVLAEHEGGREELISFDPAQDTSTSWVIEDAFCVSDDAFEVVRDTIDEFRVCGQGEYLQMFNLGVFGPGYTNFKLTLP